MEMNGVVHIQLTVCDFAACRAFQEARWAQGYYSVLFEDPDGIRLEANYVPGKGNLASEVVLPLNVERVTRGTSPDTH